MSFIEQLKKRAAFCKLQLHALAVGCRDPRVPWYAKAFALLVVAYALSPVDLIPDFIPVLGYLDDLVILPLGIVLAIRMIPPQVLEESRAKIRAGQSHVQRSKSATILLVSLWAGAWAAVAFLCFRWFFS